MYTQCPDCDTAFRVTAEVLKQAAGMVRCGGCGNAFNALEYLTETKPEAKAAPAEEPQLPELKPEPLEPLEVDAVSGDLPRSISAEQSAALLKTLDQLAGSDIRIEDTGVEWRVMDEGQDTNDAAEVFDEPGETEVDELLEEAPTPVDQFLTATPDQIDAEEIFEEPPEPDEVRTTVDELRFDDNTPLPDDFDFDEAAPVEEPADEEAAEAPAAEDTPETPDDMQVDLEFGEADDWESLLDEVDDEVTQLEERADDAGEPEDAESEASEPEEPEDAEPSVDPGEMPVGEQPPDMDTQFAIQAEAMGIDLSGIHETEEAPGDDEMTHDLDLEALLDEGPGEDTRIQQLLQTQSLEEQRAEDAEVEEEPVAEPSEASGEAADEESEADADESEELVESLELDLAAAEAAIDASASGEFEALELDDEELESLELADVDEDEREAADIDDDFEMLDVEDIEDAEEDPEPETADFDLPPMSEEEQTINMQIDQDLLAIAVEDEDGFASTIVKGSLEEILEEERGAEDKKKKKKAAAKENIPGTVETIIMEGESIRSDIERERLEEEAEILAGIRADTRAQRKKGLRGGRRRTDPPSWGKIAAAVVLFIVLVGQVLHQSREALATNELFVNTFGPLYRMIGRPLTPAWDISGWRIEKSKGNFDESGQALTIETQIRNKSGGDLPYPLIGVALTDRFEETIGHKMLEPNEYLANGLDPRKPVVPENTFIASMTIDAPSAEATGFNLKVCYRLESGQLRCAIGDFK